MKLLKFFLKIQKLKIIFRKSKNLAVYTGAGISTSSGIKDYASVAKHSVGRK